jgi:hypothetical protein
VYDMRYDVQDVAGRARQGQGLLLGSARST